MDPQQPSAPEAEYSGSGSRKNLFIIIILVILLAGSLGFGYWAYSGRQDYKNNSDQKSAAAVAAAQKQLTTQLQAQFDQQSKSPNKTFVGPDTYGSITFNYPKTWSAYVDATNQSEPINGYFYPDTVPGVTSGNAFALRVELVSTDYSQLLQQFSGQITQGAVTAKAYIPPKMQGVANVTAGTYLSGQINLSAPTQRGSMVAIKVRDKTLEIYSESSSFANDFNNTVLGSLTFVP